MKTGITALLSLSLLLAGCANSLPQEEQKFETVLNAVQRQTQRMASVIKRDNEKHEETLKASAELEAVISSSKMEINEIYVSEPALVISQNAYAQIQSIQQLNNKVGELAGKWTAWNIMPQEERNKIQAEINDAEKSLNGYMLRLEQAAIRLQEFKNELYQVEYPMEETTD